MKRKVTLPFENAPFSLMYHGTAFPIGIVQGNATTDITPWLCGKYINCSFSPNFINKFSISTNDSWFVGDKILIQQRLDLYPQLYNSIFKNNIIFYFKKMIYNNCYIHGSYNEEYIPNKNHYQKSYFSHDFLLIGYDDSKESFLSVGYSKEQFTRYYIPYDCMEQSIITLKNPKFSFNFWSYNPLSSYELNMNRIILELGDYLYSGTSMKIFSKDRFWGIEAIAQLAEYYLQHCNLSNGVDNRYTLGLCEHKSFMYRRIEYLTNKGILKNYSYLYNAERVLRLSNNVHLLGIKFNLTARNIILQYIKQNISSMISIEKSYLYDVLSDLNEHNEKRFELPIEPPQFICYNHITCANAIIRANIFDNIDKLFCSKYINCYFKESSTKHKFIISIYDNWCTTQKVMQYQLINLSKDIFLSENINVVLMIKKCLLFGSYVFGQCSYNCLVGNGGVDYSLFNYVITGYDDIAHEFTMYGVDNLDNYLCHKIGYEDFINSLYSTNKQNISFSMWRHNKNAEVVIDLQNIIFELEDYINSENRRKHYVEDKIYGLASLKKLGEFF